MSYPGFRPAGSPLALLKRPHLSCLAQHARHWFLITTRIPVSPAPPLHTTKAFRTSTAAQRDLFTPSFRKLQPRRPGAKITKPPPQERHQGGPNGPDWRGIDAIRLGFVGANVAVYLCWHIQDTQPTMWEHFRLTISGVDAGQWWLYLTSTVSHHSLPHLALNMLAFWNISPLFGALGLRPIAQFLPLLVGSGVAGGVAWISHSRSRSRHNAHLPAQGALGASGIVSGMVSCAALLRPHLRVWFLVAEISLWQWAAAYIVLDMAMLSRETGIGHSAHLGGSLFGAAWWLLVLRRRFGGII